MPSLSQPQGDAVSEDSRSKESSELTVASPNASFAGKSMTEEESPPATLLKDNDLRAGEQKRAKKKDVGIGREWVLPGEREKGFKASPRTAQCLERAETAKMIEQPAEHSIIQNNIQSEQSMSLFPTKTAALSTLSWKQNELATPVLSGGPSASSGFSPSLIFSLIERQQALLNSLETLRVVEKAGTLCAVVGDGTMIGTSFDVDMFHLEWYRVDDASTGRRTPLESTCKGFYQPTALDFGYNMVLESTTVFTEGIVSRADFGPMRCDGAITARVQACWLCCQVGEVCKFSNLRVLGTGEDCVALISSGTNKAVGVKLVSTTTSQEEQAVDFNFEGQVYQKQQGQPLTMFCFEQGTAARLKMTLDGTNSRVVTLTKLSEFNGSELSESLVAGMRAPEDRDVFALLLAALFKDDQGFEMVSSAVNLEGSCDANTEEPEWNNVAITSSLGNEQDCPQESLICELRAEIEQLKSERSREASKAIVETGKQLAHVQELDKEVERLNMKDVEVQQRITDLFEQAQSYQSKIAMLEQDKTASEQVMFQLRGDLRASETRAAGLSEALACDRATLSTQAAQLVEYEASCFLLRSSLKNEEDLRIAADSRVKHVEEMCSSLHTKAKVAKSKADSLAKELSGLLLLAGAHEVGDLEALIMDNARLKNLLKARQVEKADLVQENQALRMAGEQQSYAQAAVSSANVKSVSPTPGQIGKMLMSSLSLQKKNIVLKTDKAVANAAQAAQLHQLANSLLDSVNEKDELINEQRFANRMLADKLATLEREAVRWRR